MARGQAITGCCGIGARREQKGIKPMNKDELVRTAKALVAKGKGILAADESSGTIKKRFDVIGVESIESNRRDYREMLFRASDAMRNYISGVILYDETNRQKASDGTALVKSIEA